MAQKERDSGKRKGTRRWIRISIIVAIVFSALALTYHLTLPLIVEAYIKGQLEDVAEGLDRKIEFERFELEALHRYSFYGLTVSDPGSESESDFLTVDRLQVTLDRTRLFARQVVLRGIELHQPVLYLRDGDDGSSNYQTIYTQLQEALGLSAPADDETTDQVETPAPDDGQPDDGTDVISRILDNQVPRVRIVGARLDTEHASADFRPPQVDSLDVEVNPSGEGYACTFELVTEFEPIDSEILTRPVHHIELSGRVEPNDEVGEVTLMLGDSVEFSELPGVQDLMIRVGTVGFEYPYTFHFEELEFLDRQTGRPVFTTPEITVSLREVTTVPELFYISLVRADDVRLYVEVDKEGNTNIDRMLGMMGSGPLTALFPQQEPEIEEGELVADEDEPVVEDPILEPEEVEPEAEPSPIDVELSRRKWWEIAPQTTHLTNVSIEVVIEDEEDGPARTVDVEIPSIIAAQRLLNFQMDVSGHIDISERGVGSLGSVDIDGIYYYMTKYWGMELAFDDLDLARFVDIFPHVNTFDLQSGVLNGELTLSDERDEQDYDLTGEARLTDFAFQASSLDAAELADIDLTYSFDASLDNDDNFQMHRGELRVGDVAATVELDLDQLDVAALGQYLVGFKSEEHRARERGQDDPLPFTEARLRLDVEPQPIMNIYNAVPAALRTTLDGTEMTGDLGFRIHASALYQLDDRGRLEVDVPRPEVAEVFDQTVQLVALPEAVDVRRLRDDFDFTFVDGIGEMRPLAVGVENPRWVTLTDISPTMIESILNTEDQSFCTNDGFNWLQFRRVVSGLLENREFGRGASTISMQLVKNVFLSRERILSRKITEMFLTYWMGRLVPKERSLEVYLNIIEFGPIINGIAEAAEHYFGKLPADLTWAEATFLVSIVPNPREYHFYWEQGAITDRWWEHMQRYLRRLQAREVITEAEYEEALRERPEFYHPAEGDPVLRPPEPVEPELPPEWVLPFLLDDSGNGPPQVVDVEPQRIVRSVVVREELPAGEEVGWHCPTLEEWNEETGRYIRTELDD